MQDAIAAYVRAIEASDEVSGIFNIASGNYTVGEIADYVKEELDGRLGGALRLELRNITDFRNYKVSCEKAIRSLSFKPQHDVASIVGDLFAHRDAFADFRDPRYYNIEVFKSLDRQRERAAATSPA
jgi:nucleoside-diphosphate-sugar epimerase